MLDAKEQARPAVAILDELILRYLAGIEDGFCSHIAPLAEHIGVDREIARGHLRSLADRGLAQYQKGLWYDDGLPAGSGYGITEAGRAQLREVAA